MEPVNRINQSKCNQQNSCHYTRTNKCYDDNDDCGDSSKHCGDKCNPDAYTYSCPTHGTWPVKRDTWTCQQMNYPDQHQNSSSNYDEMAGVVNSLSDNECSETVQGQRRLGAKVDVVYSLLGMLGGSEGRLDMSETLLTLSNSIDSCLIMRQSGCLPLLIQLIHANGHSPETRERASRALHNIIHARSDEKIGRREARVLRLLEQVRDYCQMLRVSLKSERPLDDLERHPGPTIAALMKLSFDEAHRHAMCQLGGLHAVTELIEMDHASHGSDSNDQSCITLRRYAGMALTNLTFGDGNNKALLCSFREFMKALVSQLRSLSDDLRQVTASVLRNLSWRADSSSKQTLREVGAVTALMTAAMEGRKESTLKSILSALWNLSAHCSTNKVDICAVDGALAFLVDMLSYRAPSKTLSIVENAGGILRNVSSHIAVREDYRTTVRERGCLQVLLRQLRSPSLTVVSNACGTLWNLSARCQHDQRMLWDLGAVPMLRSLVHSKHKMISMGSSAALKNLLNARPCGSNLVHLDSTARGLGLPTLPSLVVRRQRALEQEIDQNLSETCDNIEPSTSPINKDDKFSFKIESNYGTGNINSSSDSNQLVMQKKYHNSHGPSHHQLDIPSKINGVPRSDSKESMRSVTSTHSDTIYERVNRHMSNVSTSADLQIKQQSSSLHSAVNPNLHDNTAMYDKMNGVEKRHVQHYRNIVQDALGLMDMGRNIKSIASTISWAVVDDQKSSRCSLMRSSIKDTMSPTDPIDMAMNKSPSDYELFGHKTIAGNCTQLSPPSPPSPSSSSSSPPLPASYQSTSGLCDGFGDKQNFMNKSMFMSTSGSHKASENDLFGDYAETDLDEPTNYSLRYAERNSDEDDKPRLDEYLLETEQLVEDTVKTYCTEGTPHVTPLNSSRAASHTDLQCDKIKQFAGKLDSKNTDNIPYFTTKSSVSHIPVSSGGGKKLTDDCGKTEQLVVRRLDQLSVNQQSSAGDCSRKHLDSLKSMQQNDKIMNDMCAGDMCGLRKQQANGVIDTESLTESMASDGDDDDEDLLAACIHIGMKNNRHMQSYRRNSHDKSQDDDKLAIDDGNLNNRNLSALNSSDGQMLGQLNNLLMSREMNVNILSAIDDKQLVKNNLTINNLSCSGSSSDKKYQKSNSRQLMNTDVGDGGDGSGNPTLLPSVSSESIESYDSVARSEQVLLELCIKSGTTKPDQSLTSSDSPVTTIINTNMSSNSSIITEMDSFDGCAVDTKNSDDTAAEYRRQRDPDAMIASLDRLTATLVQQTEAMRERESSTMRQSIQSDTWNEDSPNDSSFPTISMSVPLIASFKSDIQDDTTTVTLTNSHDDNRVSPTIARRNDALPVQLTAPVSGSSLQTIDDIKPPSAMNSLLSLTTSCNLSENQNFANFVMTTTNDDANSTSLPPSLLKLRIFGSGGRKKSLPVSCIAKFKIHDQHADVGSLENLLNDSIGNVSQLENVKPPSIMDDLLDSGDMENSMISVASITSEIVDMKSTECKTSAVNDQTFDIVKSASTPPSSHHRYHHQIQHIKQNYINSASNSLSEYLDNINPPSLFNEISEIDDTTMMDATETMCSDTLCTDQQLVADEINPDCDDNFVRLMNFNGDNSHDNDNHYDNNDTDDAATPISTEYSSTSTESTPKKLKKHHLTPKQRRQLTKDRYRTYTIAAELIKNGIGDGGECRKPSKLKPKSLNSRQSLPVKLTPKQRRQEDPMRFQTQVLHPLPKNLLSEMKLKASLIPSLRVGSHAIEQQAIDANSMDNNKIINGHSVDVQTVLANTANVVLYNKFNSTGSRVRDESLLDCETLSLVSNDSDAEKSLRTRLGPHYPQQISYSHENSSETRCGGGDGNDSNDGSDVKIDVETGTHSEPKIDMTNDNSEVSESENEFNKLPKGPRIIKPINRIDDVNVESPKPDTNIPKGIRGRRKPLYSNPMVKKVSNLPTVVGHGGINRTNVPPIVRGTRATLLKQNVNVVSEQKSQKSPVKNLIKKSSIPQRKSTGSSSGGGIVSVKPKIEINTEDVGTSVTQNGGSMTQVPKVTLERQNTFTKDEPEMENAPTVLTSPGRVKLTKPIRSLSSTAATTTTPKVAGNLKKITGKSSQSVNKNTLIKCASAERIAGVKMTNIATNKRHSSTEIGSKKSSTSQIVKKSSQQQQQQLEERSNGSVNSNNCDVKKSSTKLAVLWRKYDDKTTKQHGKLSDTKMSLTAAAKLPINCRLFRSSTFNGITSDNDDETNGCFDIDEGGDGTVNNTNIADAPCKIPVRSAKVNNKNSPVRKQLSVDSSDKDHKRISRLGSFMRVESKIGNLSPQHDSSGGGGGGGGRTPISAIVAPFNYTPRTKLNAKSRIERDVATNSIVTTASSKVTTV